MKLKKHSLVISLLASAYAFAQEHERTLDSLVIYHKKEIYKTQKKFSENALPTQVLQTKDLERTNPIFIEQTLGALAGVQVEKRTSFGGQRVVVRGYGNDQKFNNWGVKFYLNEVPLTNADGVTILEDIDFSQINGIEVIKGPASTRYGGGSGGTVKFSILPDEKKGMSISNSLLAGSFGLFQNNTKIQTSNENSTLLFNYGHLESKGYRPRGNTNKNNYSFLGSFTLNPHQTLTAYASHSNSFEGVPGQISLQDYYQGKDPGNAAYARRNAANHFISNRVTVGHQWQILSELSNATSIYYHHLDTQRTAAGAHENSMQPSYGFRSVFQWNKKVNNDFSNHLEWGAEYSVSRSLISNYRFDGKVIDPALQMRPISRASYFKYNNYAFSAFIMNRLSYEPWALDLLVGTSGNTMGYHRLDLLRFPGLVQGYNKDLSFQKSFSMELTPHIALQKKWKNQVFNLSYSQGFNPPTAATSFIRGISETNDHLKAEKAKMWDFTAQGLLDNTNFNYQISLFHIDVSNKLTQLWNPNSGGYSYWANTGQQVNKGIEASIGYLYSSEGFVKSIAPHVNMALYDFKYKNFSEESENTIDDYSGKRVVGVPTSKYALGLDITTQIGLYLNNSFNYLSDVFTDFDNEINVKGFHQLNMKFGYRKSFGKWDLNAYIAGNNLTNQVNYSFLFVGNAVGDSDFANGYPENVTTDITPGPSKAYFFGGLDVKYSF